MVGKTNVAGARLRSVIAVTYPEGSVCTCSDGTKTLKAKDTSGKALFNVPVGTWTVNCTDGSETASEAVSITENGQIKTIILSYTLVLYNAGYDNVSVTGGWESKRGCVLTKNSDNLYAAATVMYSANTGIFATKNKIDLSQYKTLRYKGKNVANLEGYFGIVISASIPAMGTDPSPSSAAWVNFGAGELAESSIDISSLTGTYYVGCHVLQGETATGSGYLYFMELVP